MKEGPLVLNNTRISGDSTRGSGAGGMRRKGLCTVMKGQVLGRGTWRTACTVAFLPPDFESRWENGNRILGPRSVSPLNI